MISFVIKYKKMSCYIRERTCPIQDNGMLEIFYRCSRNYVLYKMLKHNLPGEYKRITKFHRGFAGIEYSYSDAEFILLNEYFLWLNHNDREELELLLRYYGDCLAEKLCYYSDIFVYEHDDDPTYIVNLGNIEEETKKLVEQLLRPSIAKRMREINTSSNNSGIFNTLTGKYVQPRDDTYYIDDFRLD